MNQPEDKTDGVAAYYSRHDEQPRLAKDLGQIEFIRKQFFIRR